MLNPLASLIYKKFLQITTFNNKNFYIFKAIDDMNIGYYTDVIDCAVSLGSRFPDWLEKGVFEAYGVARVKLFTVVMSVSLYRGYSAEGLNLPGGLKTLAMTLAGLTFGCGKGFEGVSRLSLVAD